MSNYFYKTKKITLLFPMIPFGLVKTEAQVYTSLSIINNSDIDIRVIEKDDNNSIPDASKGTILGSKKMLTYDNVPKNAVYVFSNIGSQADILIKYSE